MDNEFLNIKKEIEKINQRIAELIDVKTLKEKNRND